MIYHNTKFKKCKFFIVSAQKNHPPKQMAFCFALFLGALIPGILKIGGGGNTPIAVGVPCCHGGISGKGKHGKFRRSIFFFHCLLPSFP